MKGKVLGNNGNKYETFVANTGTPVSIVPVAKKNGIKWYELDADEPNYSGITRNQLSILGQTTITIIFTTIRKAQAISALVCREEGEESLIDLDTLKEMVVQSPDFYAILPSRMVGRSEEKSRKILMEIPALLS